MIEDGILVLNKPRDWTSHDCVAICRRVLRLKGVKKIGHGGTLDPMAEGVLPIFIGQATRIMEYLELDTKRYTCRLQLGITTDTQDIWGQILAERSFDGVTEEGVLAALEGFRGAIEQMPPMYSAVRIDGRHLYDYARKAAKHDRKNEGAAAAAKDAVSGQKDEALHNIDRPGSDAMIPEALRDRIKPRKVYISSLDVEEIDLQRGQIQFSVECSKGTYIRTICSDLGQMLGCGAAMTALRRTAIGSIDLSRSISPEVIKGMAAAANRPGKLIESGSTKPTGGGSTGAPEDAGALLPSQARQGRDAHGDSNVGAPDLQSLDQLLLPADTALTHFGIVTMPADRARYFRQGNSIRLHQVTFQDEPSVPADPITKEIPCNARGRRYDRIYRVYQEEDGLFLGTGYRDEARRELRADKVFQPLNEPKRK